MSKKAAKTTKPAKAKAKLGWTPKVSFEQLVTMMVDADMDRQQGKTVTA